MGSASDSECVGHWFEVGIGRVRLSTHFLKAFKCMWCKIHSVGGLSAIYMCTNMGLNLDPLDEICLFIIYTFRIYNVFLVS